MLADVVDPLSREQPGEHLKALGEHRSPPARIELLAETRQLAVAAVVAEPDAEDQPPLTQVIERHRLARDAPAGAGGAAA